jgi:hypothetical protein
MGAHDFTAYVSGTMSAADAYRQAVEQARYEYGADGYNGTISTTSGFQVVQREPVSAAAANDLVERYWETEYDEDQSKRPFPSFYAQKWETCGAIAILDDSTVRRRTRTVVLRVSGPDMPRGDALRDLAAANLAQLSSRPRSPRARGGYGTTVRPSETVESVRVLSDEPTRRVASERTKGRTKTEYLVMAGGRTVAVCGSQSEAFQAAKNAAAQWAESRFGGDAEFTVTARTVRETGEPLAVARVVTVSRKLKVEVSLATMPAERRLGGWLFFGLASC